MCGREIGSSPSANYSSADMTSKKRTARPKKVRTDIPRDVAARIQFFSNRTCCICRIPDKPIQIHHLDENPNNHDEDNLAVLCLDCHDKTMIRGGFGRKLDAEQIVLYRLDWYRTVTNSRASNNDSHADEAPLHDLTYATTIAEIYREEENYDALARHYHLIGNVELRDKYIEQAISSDCDAGTVIYLRSIQKKIDLIPEHVLLKRTEELRDKKWTLARARFHKHIGKHLQAASDYVDGISDRLREERFFTAAYYLKELSKSGIIERLFERALQDAEDRKDLWWQVRALEELGRYDDSRELVLKHEKEILDGDDNLLFRELLALAKGDRTEWLEARKELARSGN